ncbi:MAG: hypothetical protein ACOVNL_10600 [Prochlorococcaceae cyanobacterium]|jgi:hypothetical protein
MPFPARALDISSSFAGRLGAHRCGPARRRSLSRLWLPLLGGLLLPGLAATAASAASPLLESVKQNPALAKSLCAEFRQYNTQGLSATSAQAVAATARQRGLSPMDAEVLTTYVIGLHCPDVR